MYLRNKSEHKKCCCQDEYSSCKDRTVSIEVRSQDKCDEDEHDYHNARNVDIGRNKGRIFQALDRNLSCLKCQHYPQYLEHC